MDGDTSPWHGRHVLVAGCTGFLGSAVTRELITRGAVVVGLVRDRGRAGECGRETDARRFRPVRGRVEDAARLHSAMAVHEVSAVFDLTGNAPGTAALLRAAGLYHPRVPVVTARPVRQLRVACEDVAPATLGVARFGEVFGADSRSNGFVARATQSLLAGERAPRGDTAVRDYVFVRDAARACLAVAEAVAVEGRSHDLTFRSGWALSEAELVGRIGHALAGRGPEAELEPPPNPLEWRPESTLDAALAETLAWHREVSHAPLAMGRPARRAA